MGIFSWGKYTKIIINTEKQFIQTWNNTLFEDEKTEENYLQVAMIALFFYSEKSSLTPDDFSKMILGIRKSSPFYRLISGVTAYGQKAFSDYYSNTYRYYLSAISEGKSTNDAFTYAAEQQSKLDGQLNF